MGAGVWTRAGRALMGGWLVVGLATAMACGRLGFDPLSQEQLDGGGDPRIDGSRSDGGQPFWQGSWTATAPILAEAISSDQNEFEPFVLPDRLTMVFASGRPGGLGGVDVYSATRATAGDPFDGVTSVPLVNTTRDDTRLSVTTDGTLWFMARDTSANPVQSELYTGPAASPGEFPEGLLALDELNTSANEYDPWPADGGLRLYFVTANQPGSIGDQDIWMAERSSIDEPFAAPTLVGGVNSEFNDDNPTLSEDELFIMFGSNRPGTLGFRDLWYATRSDRDAPFGQAEPVPMVNSEFEEFENYFNEAGDFFFVSNRDGVLSIYQSQITSTD